MQWRRNKCCRGEESLYLDGSPAWFQHVPLPPRRLARGCSRLFLRPSLRKSIFRRNETETQDPFPVSPLSSTIFVLVIRTFPPCPSSPAHPLSLLCPSATSLPFSASLSSSSQSPLPPPFLSFTFSFFSFPLSFSLSLALSPFLSFKGLFIYLSIPSFRPSRFTASLCLSLFLFLVVGHLRVRRATCLSPWGEEDDVSISLGVAVFNFSSRDASATMRRDNGRLRRYLSICQTKGKSDAYPRVILVSAAWYFWKEGCGWW